MNIKILKALADETRINIVVVLLRRPMSVSKIVELVGKSQPNISISLRKLEEAGIISSRKEGNKVIYKIRNKEKIEKLLSMIENV